MIRKYDGNKENEQIHMNKILKKSESESNTIRTEREIAGAVRAGKFQRKTDMTMEINPRDLSLNTEETKEVINTRQFITRVSEVPDNINLKKSNKNK